MLLEVFQPLSVVFKLKIVLLLPKLLFLLGICKLIFVQLLLDHWLHIQIWLVLKLISSGFSLIVSLTMFLKVLSSRKILISLILSPLKVFLFIEGIISDILLRIFIWIFSSLSSSSLIFSSLLRIILLHHPGIRSIG